MKLSFSLSTKPSSKQQSNLKPPGNFKDEEPTTEKEYLTNFSAPNKEFVTEFDPSKTLTDAQQSKKFVIPPKPNEWRPFKKMKNLDLPVRSDGPDLSFEVEAPSSAETLDSSISFGLNLRQSKEDDEDNKKLESTDMPKSDPIERVMLQKLKNDLKRLPDDRGFKEFEDVPVEGFGAALLAGYGWYEGRGIGKNAKEDVKVVQYERRTAKEGLGFISDMHTDDGTKKKEKEREEGGRHNVGRDVRIVGGRHVGLKGRIVEIMGSGETVVLKLSRSEAEVTVGVGDIADLGSVEEERCLKKLKELKVQEAKDEMGGSSMRRVKASSSRRSHKGSRDEENQDKKKQSRRSGEERGNRKEEERTTQVSWLTSRIRVRIISKELKGGRLYLKKGEIVDVVGPTTCDISMDDSRELIQGVRQDLLETALPRHGGPVLILYGKHKGVHGNLVEKDSENDTGVVRNADSHELLNVRLEQISEYIGDPSDIGY